MPRTVLKQKEKLRRGEEEREGSISGVVFPRVERRFHFDIEVLYLGLRIFNSLTWTVGQTGWAKIQSLKKGKKYRINGTLPRIFAEHCNLEKRSILTLPFPARKGFLHHGGIPLNTTAI